MILIRVPNSLRLIFAVTVLQISDLDSDFEKSDSVSLTRSTVMYLDALGPSERLEGNNLLSMSKKNRGKCTISGVFFGQKLEPAR